ncbi:FHA domain-containing protein [Aristaeella hokkaidonensis]|uniref:Uncharacterized protein n=1 Tax=Aristaeella hokkaidonensis TaxID=3046382 RepID=A0AC61NCD5_9FIRM|nr:FHA domain-containing protein [Aristaeella hokkaidonensis]QUC68321.1 hypothetical protein JYE49_06405 [Aristaeella hokkaidonensis]SNT95285.1 hypothetical protein SAMN06297421_1125 [Aristaeella hokkaidonensis]
MFSVSPEIYSVLSQASRWLFIVLALMLLFLAFSWHHSDRKERRDRFKNLPGAGTVGELVVLSGSDELPVDTWFPVPREGVLGSLRSCDLVIPCPGVSSHHLDFSWQDGTGLLIRPRVGCEVLIDGVPVTRRGMDMPLVHGSVLQIGSAVLRLQLFAALSHTNRTFIPPQPAVVSFSDPMPQPVQVPMQYPQEPMNVQPAFYPPSWQEPGPLQMPVEQPVPVQPVPQQVPEQQPVQEVPPQAPAAPRRKRADRWKEDWSE